MKESTNPKIQKAYNIFVEAKSVAANAEEERDQAIADAKLYVQKAEQAKKQSDSTISQLTANSKKALADAKT